MRTIVISFTIKKSSIDLTLTDNLYNVLSTELKKLLTSMAQNLNVDLINCFCNLQLLDNELQITALAVLGDLVEENDYKQEFESNKVINQNIRILNNNVSLFPIFKQKSYLFLIQLSEKYKFIITNQQINISFKPNWLY